MEIPKKSIVQGFIRGALQISLLDDKDFWPTKSAPRCVKLNNGYGAKWLQWVPADRFQDAHARIGMGYGRVLVVMLLGVGEKAGWMGFDSARWRV